MKKGYSMKFVEFTIKRFRSIRELKSNMVENEPIIICGENNVGKTNILRALNIFFNYFNTSENLFVPERDIPYHKYYGSRGGTANTELIGKFLDDENKTQTITFRLNHKAEVSFKLNKKDLDFSDFYKITDILNQFKLLQNPFKR